MTIRHLLRDYIAFHIYLQHIFNVNNDIIPIQRFCATRHKFIFCFIARKPVFLYQNITPMHKSNFSDWTLDLMKYAIILLLLFLFSCKNEKPKNATSSIQTKMGTDICKICDVTSFQIKPYRGKLVRKVKHIDKAIVIESFTYFKKVDSFLHRSPKTEPIPEKYRDRQIYYRLSDQKAIYYSIAPKFDSLKMKINLNAKDSIWVFNKGKDTFNINYFKENDGVLLYKPGKTPVIWTESAYNDCEASFFRCYFQE